MWKVNRNIFCVRWPNKQSNYAENIIKRPATISKAISSFPTTEKKRYSNEGHEKKKHFKHSEKFWNCGNMKFMLFKSALLEKASWLGTATILCFNFHFKHLQFIQNHERGRSHCLLSRNVLTMPQDDQKHQIMFLQEERKSEMSSSLNYDKTSNQEDQTFILKNLKQRSIQYAAAVHNSFGMNNLQNNSKKQAFRSFQRAARLGSIQAFYNLGICYEFGSGTKMNLSRAAFCYKRAAMKGHGLASFNLAVYFLKGLGGLPVDEEVAKLLMAQAADKNVHKAQMYIALNNLESAKYSEAFQLFNSLAKKNILDGKYYLGICYENGWGVNKDEKAAFEMFSQMAITGHSKSIMKLSKYYEEGIGGCEPDLDFSAALCQMLEDQSDQEKIITLLRLKLKKALMLNKKNLVYPNTLKTGNVMHNSVSAPELSLFQAHKPKIIPQSFLAHSYLNLISPLSLQTNTTDTKKSLFFIGGIKNDSLFNQPHLQMNLSHLMIAKS